jgi:hypothetical protein
MQKRLLFVCLVLALSVPGLPAVHAQPRQAIVVNDASELVAALTPANAGRLILARRGTYAVRSPLIVPDGATLEGEGVMRRSDLPDGFEPGTETRLVPDPGFAPMGVDFLTMGHGATIRNVLVEDVAGRSGNVLGIRSRGPNDEVSALVERCEILNPKPSSAGLDGPLGRAIVVLTQNRLLGLDPLPDEDAQVSLTLVDSVIRSTTGGSALFAINFASHGRVTIDMEMNRLVGPIELTAGVSRPDKVIGATMTVRSFRNSYSSPGGALTAWTIDGGSSAPMPGFVAEGTSGDLTRFTSIDDRIEGFLVGVAAAAAKRHSLASGLISDNDVELHLVGLEVTTERAGNSIPADFALFGARADGTYIPGNGNRLRVLMAGVTGSGPRRNLYADEFGSSGPQNLGTANVLEFVGAFEAFVHRNTSIDPAPGAEFFPAGHGR